MQSNNIKNIIAQAMNPARFGVMLNKVIKRFLDKGGRHTKEENLQWLESNSSSFEQLATHLDAELWREAERVSESLEKHAARILEKIDYNLGGGGA